MINIHLAKLRLYPKLFSNKGALVFGLFFLFVFSPNCLFNKVIDDNASYVSHAFTIALDGDLNYTNEPANQLSKNQLLPPHPIGSGILAAPFIAVFSVLDRITGHPIIEDHNNYLGSWSLFGFVFALNILFFVGIYFYLRSFQLLKLLNNELWLIILFIFSSTIPFFVLNRYFLSHGFEFFAVSLLFWCIVNIYQKTIKEDDKLFYFVLFGISISLNIFLRYSNLNLFLLAPIIFHVMLLFIDNHKGKISRRLFNNTLFILLLISILSIIPNLIFYKTMFGSFIPKPSLIYNKPFWLESYTLLQIISTLLKRVPYILNITFGSEMGLLYTNPIIPIGFFSIIMVTIIKNQKNKDSHLFYKILLIGLILLFFGYGISIHLWWQGMGSSYGYRYLLQTFPIALIGIVITYNYLSKNRIRYFQYYRQLLLIFSTISIFSVVFFSSTENLKLTKKVNTFNIEKSYSGNGYILNLPAEMVKPYTWIRLVSKNAFGYLLSPIISNYDIIENKSYSLIMALTKNNKQVNEDYKKYLERSRILSYNKMSQLILLLFLWVFAGAAFYNYHGIFS